MLRRTTGTSEVATVRRVMRWGLACLVWCFCLQAWAGVYFMSPGKWQNGKITWRYNPAGLPSDADEAAILATVTRAFQAWSNVCNITAEYGGTTTTSLSQTSSRSEVVLGYAALPYPQAADAAPDSEDAASNYTYFTSGKIRISTAIGANIAYNPSTLVHEIGHLLGLDHSDEPHSIMFANPYNSVRLDNPYGLFGDDISTCANLYGAKGLPGAAENAQVFYDTPTPPKLELAVVSEQSSTNVNTVRLVNLSAVGVDYFNAYLNDNYTRALTTFTLPAGDSTLELWIKSNLPRYTLDLSQNRGGQSAKSHDMVRHLSLRADTLGQLTGLRLEHRQTGSNASWSAQGTVQTAQPGLQSLFVVALVGELAYFRSALGWSTTPTPLLTMTAPAACVFDILRDFDSRLLPTGSALFMGVGTSVQDMISAHQYHLVQVF